ncbi:HK97 gp10 family phage protein [Paenibacillus sp. GYB004]|uniref:HK97 gp10 family phage protein n=1 Tax=Paenibacillus sp. GYB004 TaxID=2994393 RepID=UPI002F96E02F
MPRWGEFDFAEIKALAKNFEEIEKALPAFIEECVHELAARLLAKVVIRTPVDTGELRRGWTLGRVIRIASGYQVEVINPVDHAIYVEFGHRTKNHKGWIEGRFMLTISEKELERELPAILQKKQEAFLKKYLG